MSCVYFAFDICVTLFFANCKCLGFCGTYFFLPNFCMWFSFLVDLLHVYMVDTWIGFLSLR
uniref:Uncharacterized protein n=1 Tax=Arundo donax TaxID=35708 RepID=A0A0A9DS39_ARUDO